MSARPHDLVREEIGDLERYLANLPPNLRDGPYGAAYRLRLTALLDELAELSLLAAAAASHAPAMDLRLRGEATSAGLVPAQLLGELLQRWQALFAALAQAATGKPTTRGVIPSEILEQCSLSVAVFAEGSFITRLVAAPPIQTTLSIGPALVLRAFEEFEALHAAGARHHDLSVVMHRLKGRVLSSYARLLQLLEAWESTLMISMAEPGAIQVRRADIAPGNARGILQILREVGSPEEGSRMTFVGLLNAGHRRTGTFEIDLGDEGTMTGRVSDGSLLDGVVIGQRYEFILAEVMTTDSITGNVETSWSLVRPPIAVA